MLKELFGLIISKEPIATAFRRMGAAFDTARGDQGQAGHRSRHRVGRNHHAGERRAPLAVGVPV